MQTPAIGMGFRFPIADQIVENLSDLDVLELIVDQYLAANLGRRTLVEEIAKNIPFLCHGVGLSLGTAIDLNPAYLDQIGDVIDRLSMPYYSEHLAFTRVPGIELAELLPLPRNEAAAERVIKNIQTITSSLSVPFYLENIAYYFDYPNSEMTEPEFINLILRETGAALLLDVENLYVNSINHSFDPAEFLDALDTNSVRALHLAGGEQIDGVFIDDHGHTVPDAVLNLTVNVLERCDPEYIVLERDRRLDRFEDIIRDVARIREVVSARKISVSMA